MDNFDRMYLQIPPRRYSSSWSGQRPSRCRRFWTGVLPLTPFLDWGLAVDTVLDWGLAVAAVLDVISAVLQ